MRSVRRKTFLLVLAWFIFTGASVLLQPFGNNGQTSPQFVPHSAYAQEDTRAVSNIVIQINENGEAVVTWAPPTEAPADYRIAWTEADQDFPSYTEDHGNAYPTVPAYTITDLTPGVRYKVTLRARYNGPAGPWTEAIEFDVLALPTATATVTVTATDAPTVTDTSTSTATATSIPAVTATPTLLPRAVSNVAIRINDNGEAVVTWAAPTEAPADYRISWAEADQGFPSYTEEHGNAYPTVPAYTITDLTPGVRYKITLRARYNGPAGPWTEAVEFDVPALPTATATVTETAASTATATSTATVTVTATPTPALDLVPFTLQSIEISSEADGELSVLWSAPSQAPTDYQVHWAKAAAEYPALDGSVGVITQTATSITITGLDEGVEYKVRVRARYYDGSYANNPQNGPWTETRHTVSGTAESVQLQLDEEQTVEPALVPFTLLSIEISSEADGELSVLWSAPSQAPTDYQVHWAKTAAEYPALDGSVGVITQTATSIAITGLDEGVEYKVRVRARYYDGSYADNQQNGPWNEERFTVPGTAESVQNQLDEEQTVEPALVPFTLQSIGISSEADGELSVLWSAPSQAPTDYQVHWAKAAAEYPALDGSVGVITQTATSIAISGLDEGVEYKVRVRARYYDGSYADNQQNGPWNEERFTVPGTADSVQIRLDEDQTVEPALVPYTILSIGTSSLADGELSVLWSAPSQAPTDYQVNWAKAAAEYPALDGSVGVITQTATSITITGLDEGVEYKVRVRARYYDGSYADNPQDGPWNETRHTVSGDLAVPPLHEDPEPSPTPAPKGYIAPVVLTSPGAGQLTVSWAAPGEVPRYFEVQWVRYGRSYSYAGSTWVAGLTTSHTITGLDSGMFYKARVRTGYVEENRCCPGTHRTFHYHWYSAADPVSAGPTPVPTEAPPESSLATSADAPTNLRAVAGHDRVQLRWNAPADLAGLDGYRIMRGAGSDGELSALVLDTNSTTTSYTDESVMSLTSYRYAVAALITDTVHTESDMISVRTLDAPAAAPTAVPHPASPYDSFGRPQLSVGVKRHHHFNDADEVKGWPIDLQANRAYRVTLYDPTVNEDHLHQANTVGSLETTGTEVELPTHSHERHLGVAKIVDEDGAKLRFLNALTIGGTRGRVSGTYLNDPNDPGELTYVFIARRTGPHYIFAFSVAADVKSSIKVSEVTDLPNSPSPSARQLYWVRGSSGLGRSPRPFSVFSYWHGAIQSNNDVDWYRVQLQANRGYSFSVASLLSSGTNTTAQYKVKGLIGPDGTTRVGDTGGGRTSFSYLVTVRKQRSGLVEIQDIDVGAII